MYTDRNYPCTPGRSPPPRRLPLASSARRSSAYLRFFCLIRVAFPRPTGGSASSRRRPVSLPRKNKLSPMNGQIAISTMLRDHAGLNGYPAKTESTDPPARSLREISLHLREKVDAFLAEEPDTPVLRSVQEHLRVPWRWWTRRCRNTRAFTASEPSLSCNSARRGSQPLTSRHTD